MEFQQMLLRVQQSCNQTETLELVFLCTDLLRKNLSEVYTVRDLFCLLQKHGLLSSEDPSLLTELLTITKRHSLLKELSLSPSLSISHVSPYRLMLFEVAENISQDDLKNIKFLLYKTLPRKALEKDLTLLQLFLEMEKVGHLEADNLETLEKMIGVVSPCLQTKINLFKKQFEKNGGCTNAMETKWRNKTDLQDISISTTPVQPASVAQNGDMSFVSCNKAVECSQLQSTEEPAPLSSYSGDAMAQMAQLSLNENSEPDPSQVKFHHVEYHSTVEEQNLKSPPANQQNTVQPLQYTMEGDWRGHCLIINNRDFSKSQGALRAREGSDVDQESLEAVFKWLGFTVELKQDCTGKDILHALNNLRRRDHKEADCVACCVLTHGYDGGVYGVDGGRVELKQLMEPLYGHNCPSLIDKPKLFFIQACQGTKQQQVVFLQSDGPNDNLEACISSDAAVPKNSIPAGADFLMAMSTVAEHVSYRHKLSGTWFIQSLCKNLEELVPQRFDLLSILTQVNNDVSMKSDDSGTMKQIPQPGFSLRKRVIFPVPKNALNHQKL